MINWKVRYAALFALDREIGDKPGGYQWRVLAFLSERLFDIYVRWLGGGGRRVAEYPLFFLEMLALGTEARPAPCFLCATTCRALRMPQPQFLVFCVPPG